MKLSCTYMETNKRVTMTVRLTPETSEKLEVIARNMNRSKSYLASETIETYVDRND